MCVRFAELERKLGEIDRARALYMHASQIADPRVSVTNVKMRSTVCYVRQTIGRSFILLPMLIINLLTLY